VAAPLSPPPSRNGRPAGPDLSKLPAAIRESLAKLAGDPAEEEKKTAPAPPMPPQTSDTTAGDR
jgi:hypothetical protein